MRDRPLKPSRRTVILLAGVAVLVVVIAVVAVFNRPGGDDGATETTPVAICDDPPTLAVTIDLADGVLEVYRVDPGRPPVPLMPDQIADGPAFSPDGTRLAVVLADVDYESAGPDATSITTIDPDGSDPETVIPLGSTLDRNPAWSPDGRTLAFVRLDNKRDETRSSVLTVPASGGEPTVRHTDDGETLIFSPDWSPDGSRLAFIRDVDEPDAGAARDAVWVMDSEGGAARELAAVGLGSSLDWSPDGSRILVSSPNSSNPMSLVDVSTGGVETLDASRSGAVWSTRPDRIVSERRADGAIVEETLTGTTLSDPVVLLAPDDLPPSLFSDHAFVAGQISVAPCPS